ncbi:hypothetical protein PTKIN_Ptkin18bG0092100 [Pterospermum kingtungense]
MGVSQSQEYLEQDAQNDSIQLQKQDTNVQPKGKTSDPEFVVEKPRAMEKITRKNILLPHNCEAILKDADSPVDMSSMDNLLSQLYSGVFLNQKRKKYWVDKKLNKNCFMLFARDLSITWGEDQRYWRWSYQKETSDVSIHVAELLQVCWLEVAGKFDVAKLSPGTLYGVGVMVMLKDEDEDEAFGWEVPVNLRLTLPNGQKIERKETLVTKPRGKWIEIPVGEFKTAATSCQNVGEIEIYIHEYDAGMWKGGLVIKGVSIRLKN